MMVADRFYISPEDYLAAERESPIKHEYRRGHVYAMVGAKNPHVLLAANLTRILGNHLESSPCIVMASDIKVRLQVADCYYYPDVVVTCHPEDLATTEDFIHYPKLVIEILSPSTQKFDRTEKFADYQTCPTLEEYALVSQTEPAIEVYTLKDQVWQSRSYRSQDVVTLAAVQWVGAIEGIYQKVPGLQ